MDGENHGKILLLMDDLGVPLFSETPISYLLGKGQLSTQTCLLVGNMGMIKQVQFYNIYPKKSHGKYAHILTKSHMNHLLSSSSIDI